MKLAFDKTSFFIFLFILFVEIIIALFIRDCIIRPYGGDVLVIVMMYYFLKATTTIRPLNILVGVFLFACLIEVAQYFNFVEIIGLKDNKIANIIIGNSFSPGDILAYVFGVIIVVLIERKNSRTKKKQLE